MGLLPCIACDPSPSHGLRQAGSEANAVPESRNASSVLAGALGAVVFDEPLELTLTVNRQYLKGGD
jgi:hypothetical protein